MLSKICILIFVNPAEITAAVFFHRPEDLLNLDTDIINAWKRHKYLLPRRRLSLPLRSPFLVLSLSTSNLHSTRFSNRIREIGPGTRAPVNTKDFPGDKVGISILGDSTKHYALPAF
ncbi:hypothetical protein PUN28_002302 [Cardiocondyla obscurior]|uniref:Uncharacterized protein n=1 Tax=Cardiocondyla obscurior TaxID=286306 RepID=A0AAW2GTL3_9HYME